MKLSKYRIQNNLIFIDYINLITAQNAKFYSNQMKIFVQFVMLKDSKTLVVQLPKK